MHDFEALDIGSAWRILVIAPHPDDEVLGTGALLATAAELCAEALVVYLTDGSASHPGSRAFPPRRVMEVREAEAIAGLAELGYGSRNAVFLRAADGGLASLTDGERRSLLEKLERCIEAFAPSLVLLPWRRDPHGDHVAASGIARLALARAPQARALEYPVWLEGRGTRSARAMPGEVRLVRFGASPAAVVRKRRALRAHRSQTGDLVDDDPAGFRLDPAMIERSCSRPEVFYEVRA